MEMVLSVLGTILMAALIVFLVLLLLLVLILFAPICYKVSGDYQEELKASGRITWLGAIVYFRFFYIAGEPEMVFRIFGVDVKKFLEHRKAKKAKKCRKKKAKKRKKGTQGYDKSTHQQEVQKIPGKNTQEKIAEDTLKADQQAEHTKDTPKTEEQERDTEDVLEEALKKKRKNESKFKKLVKNIKYRWNCIKKFLKSILSLLKKIRRKIEWLSDVREFWKKDNTKRMVCILKDNVLHLWRKLKPRVLRGKIEFGTDDPCLTGEILGVAAIFYACYGSDIQVIPDFERARFVGNLLIKGRISLITLIMILLHIIFSKEWNQFKDDIDKLKEAL